MKDSMCLFDRAAVLRCRSRTNFESEAAVRTAEAAVMDAAMPIRMSAQGFEAFMNVLAAPPAPVPELVELLCRSSPWEPGESRGRR
jgi:uncharacterized protein (DUF1778 family)